MNSLSAAPQMTQANNQPQAQCQPIQQQPAAPWAQCQNDAPQFQQQPQPTTGFQPYPTGQPWSPPTQSVGQQAPIQQQPVAPWAQCQNNAQQLQQQPQPNIDFQPNPTGQHLSPPAQPTGQQAPTSTLSPLQATFTNPSVKPPALSTSASNGYNRSTCQPNQEPLSFPPQSIGQQAPPPYSSLDGAAPSAGQKCL